MLPKERVRAALEHREADRVPILLGGTGSKMYEPVMRSMMEYYGIPQDKLVFRAAGFRYIPVCEELYDKMGRGYPHGAARYVSESASGCPDEQRHVDHALGKQVCVQRQGGANGRNAARSRRLWKPTWGGCGNTSGRGRTVR